MFKVLFISLFTLMGPFFTRETCARQRARCTLPGRQQYRVCDFDETRQTSDGEEARNAEAWRRRLDQTKLALPKVSYTLKRVCVCTDGIITDVLFENMTDLRLSFHLPTAFRGVRAIAFTDANRNAWSISDLEGFYNWDWRTESNFITIEPGMSAMVHICDRLEKPTLQLSERGSVRMADRRPKRLAYNGDSIQIVLANGLDKRDEWHQIHKVCNGKVSVEWRGMMIDSADRTTVTPVKKEQGIGR